MASPFKKESNVFSTYRSIGSKIRNYINQVRFSSVPLTEAACIYC
jgi:hypothetical protein